MDQPAHIALGQLGEKIAATYLEKRGYRILDRNYRKKWGEIDLIAAKEGCIHFVEVKSVSKDTLPTKTKLDAGKTPYTNVSYATGEYDPSENVHKWKRERLSRVIQTYLLEHFKDKEPLWQLDVASVYISLSQRQARVEMLEDIDF